MIPISVNGGTLTQKEIDMLQERAAQHKGCTHITARIDGDYIDAYFYIKPFEKIRRITGYLVGTTDRWNNAKQAELRDRVKHGV